MGKPLYTLICTMAACSFSTDAAVDLATCIRRGAEDMLPRDTISQVTCPVRSGRIVTAILAPDRRDPGEITVPALQQIGVPGQAIYYNGPDSPSIGQRVGLGSVNVHDSHFTDNRKYSNSSALGSRVRIVKLMAMSGDQFRIVLRRRGEGIIEVIALR